MVLIAVGIGLIVDSPNDLTDFAFVLVLVIRHTSSFNTSGTLRVPLLSTQLKSGNTIPNPASEGEIRQLRHVLALVRQGCRKRNTSDGPNHLTVSMCFGQRWAGGPSIEFKKPLEIDQ